MAVAGGRFGTEDAVGGLQGFQSFQGNQFGFSGAEGYEGDGEHSVLLLIRLEIKRNFGMQKSGNNR